MLTLNYVFLFSILIFNYAVISLNISKTHQWPGTYFDEWRREIKMSVGVERGELERAQVITGNTVKQHWELGGWPSHENKHLTLFTLISNGHLCSCIYLSVFQVLVNWVVSVCLWCGCWLGHWEVFLGDDGCKIDTYDICHFYFVITKLEKSLKFVSHTRKWGALHSLSLLY